MSKFLNLNKNDLIVMFLLASFFLILNISLTHNMQQLPSPLYGGDDYYQMGCINHIRYGGDPSENCNLMSDNPGYLPFFGMLEAAFANLFNLSTFVSELIFSGVLIVLSVSITYLLFRKIFKRIDIAAVGVLLFARSYPFLKYTEFATYIMAPLLVFAAYLFYKEQNWGRTLFLGVVLGISAITHSVLFPTGYIVVFSLLCYMVLGRKITGLNKKEVFENFKKLLPYAFVILILSISISMFYWFEPIFKSHIQTSPHYLEWNGPGDMSMLGLKLETLWIMIRNTFFSFGSIKSAVISSLCILGVVFLFSLKRKSDDLKFVLFVLSTGIVWALSYFITMPLFHIHFVPNYIFSVFIWVLIIGFALFSLLCLDMLIGRVGKLGTHKRFLFILLLILLIFSNISLTNAIREDKWYGVSQNPPPAYQQDLQEYVIENTDVNDVFLTTKEVGFMLNALTGRKLVGSRRAQNDAFENMDPREMAQAVILYGNDTSTKKELIKKYNVKYLYWDYYWIRSEYYLDEAGRVTGWFDPLIAFENQTYIDLLERNNVSYFVRNTYVDPSLKSQYHPTFDLILISPQNYYSTAHPWHSNLDPYLEEVWSYEENGMVIARLYAVKT